MKQYTTEGQTAKLIELGFEKPKSISSIKVTGNIITTADDLIGEPSSVMGGQITANYSIGELLSFLPLTIQWTPRVIRGNVIEYSFEAEGSELYYCNAHNELIDNLFDMCIKLKEEGVI